MKRRDPEQLNQADAPEEYQLEDIMREFGAKSPPEKPGVTSDTVVFRPIRPAPAAPDLDAPTKTAEPGKRRARQEAPPAPQEAPPARPEAVGTVRRKKPERQEEPPRREKRPPKPKAPPVRVELPDPAPTPQTLLRRCRDGLGIQRLRFALSALIAAVQLFLLLYGGFGWAFLPLSAAAVGWVSLALAAASVLLAYDVVLGGLRGLAHLRPSLALAVLPVSVLTFVHAAQVLPQGGQSYCPVLSVLLAFLLCGETARRKAMFYTARTVCGFDAPMGIFELPQLLDRADSLRRDEADVDDFMRCLDRPDRGQTVLGVYAAIMLPLSGVLAYLISTRGENGFVLSWLLLLLGATPFAGALCFSRPFSVLARRLSSFGGALCGWHGAKLFGGKHTIILRDEDIFPRANITSNGMKLFGAHKAGRVIACALAALRAADSPLADLFEGLLQAQYGKHLQATRFRVYDNNGIGAEVAGEVILVGSLGFVRSMGVHMPAGTRVRQAVYVSVDGELAGIFAVKYKPSPSTRKGLRDVLANRSFSVVLATRDFLITPELIGAKYELDTQSVIFPPLSERLRLSAIDPEKNGGQGGLIAKDTFGAFASTVAAGRTLKSVSGLSLALSLAAGVLGFGLCTLLLVWNSAQTASPLHLAAFQLVWACLNWLFSFVLLRF